jgi:hypothetical protein
MLRPARQRLAKGLDGAATGLGELLQEQHAAGSRGCVNVPGRGGDVLLSRQAE